MCVFSCWIVLSETANAAILAKSPLRRVEVANLSDIYLVK